MAKTKNKEITKGAHPLTNRLMKLIPCDPYKKSKKSNRVRKNKWVEDNGQDSD